MKWQDTLAAVRLVAVLIVAALGAVLTVLDGERLPVAVAQARAALLGL